MKEIQKKLEIHMYKGKVLIVILLSIIPEDSVMKLTYSSYSSPTKIKEQLI